MRIGHRLVIGFSVVALLVGVVASLSVSLSGQVWKLRSVELPMEQNLREVEVSVWGAIHAADAFLASADPHYLELYHRQVGDVDRFYPKYLALTDTPEERKFSEEFSLLWGQAKDAGDKMLEQVAGRKEAEDRFFQYVDKADDVIDFKIQTKLSSSDPHVLAKERAVREVEVSIWEAIHAAAQYTGLSPNISKAGHAQGTFAALMEKQFKDVDEFWPRYKALATSEDEKKAIKEFEGLWAKAVAAGREVVSLHDQARSQFDLLYNRVDRADYVIDFKMQEYIQKRVEARDEAARRYAAVTIGISVCAVIGAIAIGLVIARSIWTPLARLRHAADELAEGRLDCRVGSTRKDEIGELSRAFDHMSQQLASAAKLNQEEVEVRRRAEEALAASNQELKDFVYVASHDLREPLRKISSFGALLAESLGEKLPDDDRENLEYMIDGATRMTDMIESLLVYSRLNTKDRCSETVDLNETIEELERLELASTLEDTGGTIEVPRPLPKVIGDPTQLRQLLQNLIANGIKYRRDAVAPQIVIGACALKDDVVRIQVRDNGIGIPQEHRESVFIMFRRLHSRRKYQGTGIGLAICKRIVAKHGGHIGVESEEGGGSTFWFTLTPAAHTQAASEPAMVS